ncbi:hypothetical protein M405DRAFT_816489 [Rhizopogon salebrosus TDB-379]|nr:hypothetical protein M405DRAFT_816489 [Rhizopogon salebrosus TDB-379]
MPWLARSRGGASAHRLPPTAYSIPALTSPDTMRAYYYVRRYWAILRSTFPFLRPESSLSQQSL